MSQARTSSLALLVVVSALLAAQQASSSGIFELNLSTLIDAYGRDLRLDCCAWQNSSATTSHSGEQQMINSNSIQNRANSQAASHQSCDPTKCQLIIRICVKNYQTQIDPSQCTFGELTAQVTRPENNFQQQQQQQHLHSHSHHHQHSHLSPSSMSSLARFQQQQQLAAMQKANGRTSSLSSANNIHHQRMLLQQLTQAPSSSSSSGTARALRQISFDQPISFPFNFTWPGAFSLVIDAWYESPTGLQQLVAASPLSVATLAGPAYQSSPLQLSGLPQSRLGAQHSSSSSSSSSQAAAAAVALQQAASAAAPGTSYDLYKKQLIIQHSIHGWLSVKNEWTNGAHKTDAAQLAYSYRVTCQPNYFGEQCNILCRPRDDVYGHFVCSDLGDVQCLPGWQGKYCEQPVCAQGCAADQGNCTRPNECNCRIGWTGASCDQCVRHPGCVHGTCERPHECNCEHGWGGLLCNEDLRYCTNHSPCKNGALCMNTFDLAGVGSYTCACEEGFVGKNCETRATSTHDQQPASEHYNQIPAAAAPATQQQAPAAAPTAAAAAAAANQQQPQLTQSNQLAGSQNSSSQQTLLLAQQKQQPLKSSSNQRQHQVSAAAPQPRQAPPAQQQQQQQQQQAALLGAPSQVAMPAHYTPVVAQPSQQSQSASAPAAASLDHRVMVAYGIIIVCMVILVVLLLLRVFFERLSGAVVGCGQRLVASGSSGTLWPSQMIVTPGDAAAAQQAADATDGGHGRHRSRSSSRRHRHHHHGHGHSQKYDSHHRALSSRSLAPADDVATLQNHQNIYKSRTSISTDKAAYSASAARQNTVSDDTCSSSDSSISSADETHPQQQQQRRQHAAAAAALQAQYSASAHYGHLAAVHAHAHQMPYGTYQAAASLHHPHHSQHPGASYHPYHHLAAAHSVHNISTYGRAAPSHHAQQQQQQQQQQHQQQPPPPPYTISGNLSHHASYGAGLNPIYSSHSATYAPVSAPGVNYHPASMILGPPAPQNHPIYSSHSTYGTAATLAAHCVSTGVYGGLSGAASASTLPATSNAVHESSPAAKKKGSKESAAAQAQQQQQQQTSSDDNEQSATTSSEQQAVAAAGEEDSSPYGNLRAAQSAASAQQDTTSGTSGNQQEQQQQQQQHQSPYYFYMCPPYESATNNGAGN